jgi:trans-aconitate methyltransferase
MDRRAHWQTVYQNKSEDDVSWFQARPARSLELIRRTGLVAEGARLIDVGGGASRLVDALVAQGDLRVTVLDIAEAALAQARKRLGQQAERVEWIAADILRWTPPQRYDLWHDRALFHFLTDPADRQDYTRTLAAGLSPGGQAVIATFAPDGPERCSGLPVCRYDPDGLAAALGTGFRLLDSLTEDHVTPAGKLQKFQYCRLVRG